MSLTAIVANENYQAPAVTEGESLAEYLLSDRSLSVLNTLLEPQAVPLFHRAIRTLMIEQSENFKDVTPKSVFLAVARTASLGLRLDRDFGHVWLIPYRSDGVSAVQMQIGYKGLIYQLIRSGRFKSINACSVYETDDDADIRQRLFGIRPPKVDVKVPIVGFCAGYETVDGYTDYEYMSYEEMEHHKMTYSQSANSKFSPWNTAYTAMAHKTVLKRLINRSAIHHALINQGVTVPIMETLNLDQVVIGEDGTSYADNPNSDTQSQQAQATTGAEVADLTQNPTRFESLIKAIKTGKYQLADALDPTKVKLSVPQTMVLQSMSTANPINLSKDNARFNHLVQSLEQGTLSFDMALNENVFTLNKPQRAKLVELKAKQHAIDGDFVEKGE